MPANQSDLFRTEREAMVELIRRRGIDDPRLLEAMRGVRRDKFVSDESAEAAYDDLPLLIGHEQTISQPYVVAIMASALRLQPQDRVLEIGTGSGYAAAVMSRIASNVYTVERLEELAARAEENLAAQCFDNVEVLVGDGTCGWPEHAPYNAISVAAGGPKVPSALIEQLDVGGRLVIPIGPSRDQQKLIRLTRHAGALQEEDLGPVRFVPLVGEQGW